MSSWIKCKKPQESVAAICIFLEVHKHLVDKIAIVAARDQRTATLLTAALNVRRAGIRAAGNHVSADNKLDIRVLSNDGIPELFAVVSPRTGSPDVIGIGSPTLL